MDTQTITQLISSVGFPIAAFCWSAFMIRKEREEARDDQQKLREEHRTEITELTKVINENNAVLQGLKQLIEDKL